MNKSRNNSIKSRTIDTDIQPLADNSQSPKKYNTRQASFLNPSVMLSKIKEKSVLNGTYNVSNFVSSVLNDVVSSLLTIHVIVIFEF